MLPGEGREGGDYSGSVPTLSDLLKTHTHLEPPEIEWLHQLVGDWQMVSDLSFADLVLWVPDRTCDGWVAVAHCRPSTGATVYYDDVVGLRAGPGRRVQVERAWESRRICRQRDPEWHDDVPVRQEAIPVIRAGRTLAVVARHTNLAAARTPSRLELTYLQCADDLARMIATGDFPYADAPTGPRRGAPRVGDGLLRLDREGRITYASPNALSALHRLGYVGELVDQSLAEISTPLLDTTGPVDESLPLVLSGRAPWRSELEARGITLSLRAIPLVDAQERVGALLLVRDVSELRRRELELMSKDATIREVHHRVKNNLQTVAALLRLQARRIDSAEGRAALVEAMRRVATIALVHETLSEGLGETVDFDEVVERIVALAVELAGARHPVRVRRRGRFGELGAQNATPLALVLTELVTNAVEHGLASRGGVVVVGARRVGQRLTTVVRDDGDGLPEGFTVGATGLGTQIVQALVGGEMRGQINWRSPASGGTEVTVRVTLRDPAGSSEAPYGDFPEEDPALQGTADELLADDLLDSEQLEGELYDDAGRELFGEQALDDDRPGTPDAGTVPPSSADPSFADPSAGSEAGVSQQSMGARGNGYEPGARDESKRDESKGEEGRADRERSAQAMTDLSELIGTARSTQDLAADPRDARTSAAAAAAADRAIVLPPRRDHA
ncbi:MAG: two-component system, sensor histidine kinase PdtaS [Actinomycetota bacterium]|nr:two-component system, sensor histidine kinase PdtaS [Actinomycetota bacterium]